MRVLILSLLTVSLLFLSACEGETTVTYTITQTQTETITITQQAQTVTTTTSTIDWSQVNIPAVGEKGNWALAPGMRSALTCVFSTNGKTIYALGDSTVWGLFGSGISFLIKSDDQGHTWSLLPALEELQLHETFNIVTAGDTLFISSTDFGIYRSVDGGQTCDRLPMVPGLEEGEAMIWDLDATIDASGNPVILVATYYSRGLGGLWMLSYPYNTWEDMCVGNAESGTKYQVCSIAFSPTYAQDKQIMAVISDLEYLRLSIKYGDEDWSESIADAYIPDVATNCDLEIVTDFVFPDNYDSRNPVVFLGIGLYTEHLYQMPQYTDLYRIDGKLVGSGASVTTDLDVGGKDTSTPIYSVAIKGPADSATILAGGVAQVYRSTDGGQSWQGAHKPPSGGAVTWLTYNPTSDDSTLVYCVSTDSWDVFVPRGASVHIGEPAFCRSVDGGITWNELSMIGTTIDETVSHVVSPNYIDDNTLFMLTRSYSTLIAGLDEDEVLYITRKPDETGINAEVIVVVHGGNPPSDRMKIGDQEYVAGTGPMVVLNDSYPNILLEVYPLLEQPGMRERFEQYKETNPWYVEQYLALCEQPRNVVIYVLAGSVNVIKGEANEIPFPSTESLWKTTDGGTTWERIMTSGLKLLVNGEEVQVGPLESIILSNNFAQDNTLFVHEGGNNPRTWVSTDGGATFTIQE